jgi:predicted O-methyltransferase YrrM
MCARSVAAKRVVEFGSSMGISTIYLACAVRDNGGGCVIGTELESSKVARATQNVSRAGISDQVELREGDALQTLRELPGEVDMVMMDGAISLYLAVLKLLEPHLRSGALIISENALEGVGPYIPYLRDPKNGYLSMPIPIEEGRGNEISVRVDT